jgi:uncharacterized protein (DUF4415 family)
MTSKKNKKHPKERIVRMTLAEARERRRKRPLRPGELTSKQLANIRDEDIDFSDIPPLDERFFRLAKILTPVKKQTMTVRIDTDVYEWLKSQGPGYQTRINAILKAMMLMQTGQA